MTAEAAYEITTKKALHALAHPLRLRLLGLLRLDGPATATTLARRVGESSGSTSYHLRQLAAAGFIEEASDLGTRRERWWRARHQQTSWSPARFLDSAEARRDDLTVRRELLRLQQVVLEQWLAEETAWPVEWVEAAAASDHVLDLTAEELLSLKKDYLALIERYTGPVSGGTRRERVWALFHAVPVRDLLG